MNGLTKQEYLELCQRLLDGQYGDDDDAGGVEMQEWIPAVSKIKEKMAEASTQGVIDLTKAKKEKIKESLYKCTNFKVHNFSIRVRNHNPTDDVFDISLYEDVTKTPSGNPCKMTYPVRVDKDNRFLGRTWVSHFTYDSGRGNKISPDTMIDIVRFLQIIKKLSAFL